MLNDHASYRYETAYKGPFMITHCWTSGTVTLKCGVIKIKHNIRRIKPYTSDTNIVYIKYWEIIIYNATLGKYLLYTSVLH